MKPVWILVTVFSLGKDVNTTLVSGMASFGSKAACEREAKKLPLPMAAPPFDHFGKACVKMKLISEALENIERCPREKK